MGRSGFRIGKIAGIVIRIDWSWLIIALLITWNLASIFAQAHPTWGLGLTWGMGLLAALLFFLSVLAHELAHSLVARAQGVPVRSITLFLFGGVSDIQREPSSPGNEFLMAIVGPLSSIVLGGLLVLLAGATGVSIAEVWDDPVKALANLNLLRTMLLWLGSINVIVGLFNLIPGFPLDGGRVLRSALWAATRSLRQATRWASWVGQGIAALLMLAGIAMAFGVDIPFFGTGFLSGLWLVFIGWFLNSASVQSYQQVVIHDLLTGTPVARMMRVDPPTVPPDCMIADLVRDHLMGTDEHAFPVLEGERLVGIIALDDVRRVAHEAWSTTVVRQAMTPADRLVTTTPEEDAAAAWDKIAQRNLNQLPVLQDGHLVGLLRRQDVVRWLQLHSQLMRA